MEDFVNPRLSIYQISKNLQFSHTCDALRDLIPFVQFKKLKNTHGGVLLLVKLKAQRATLLKVTLPAMGVFHLF